MCKNKILFVCRTIVSWTIKLKGIVRKYFGYHINSQMALNRIELNSEQAEPLQNKEWLRIKGLG